MRIPRLSVISRGEPPGMESGKNSKCVQTLGESIVQRRSKPGAFLIDRIEDRFVDIGIHSTEGENSGYTFIEDEPLISGKDSPANAFEVTRKLLSPAILRSITAIFEVAKSIYLRGLSPVAL